ncbi:hypothetical protein [Gryllotalpicola koreensis]|uniref:Uncharacterized protein n=1 Tax=Gryllotalpicola koreensis TaxID=993086 RepID=A0ABP8A1Y5_9MICO
MTALFSIDAQVDSVGVEWSIGTDLDVNALLDAEHYLGPLTSGGYELIIIGSVEDHVVAAQVWRNPTSRHLPADGSWLELSRWCLTSEAGANAGSRMHRYAVRTITRRLPKVTTLVSYSDPGHGHTGALYRACNWVWRPTWQRLRPPPTGNGSWDGDRAEAIKDRWIFGTRHDAAREQIVRITDMAAIRYWREHATDHEIRWARKHPQLDIEGIA